MAIAETDIEYRLSGGANNESPAAALGAAMSTKAGGIIDPSTPTNSLFDDVSGAEAAAGDTEYRCFFVKNKHGSLTLKNAKIWITQDASSASDATAIALSGSAVNAEAETIANESTAPSGPSFSAPASEGEALSIGDIPAGQFKAIWIRRTISASASPKNNDELKLKVAGETAE